MEILVPVMLFLLWSLFVIQIIAAPVTGWIWAKAWIFHKDFQASHLLTGFIAYRDESPFIFWSTWAGYLMAAVMLSFVMLMGGPVR